MVFQILGALCLWCLFYITAIGIWIVIEGFIKRSKFKSTKRFTLHGIATSVETTYGKNVEKDSYDVTSVGLSGVSFNKVTKRKMVDVENGFVMDFLLCSEDAGSDAEPIKLRSISHEDARMLKIPLLSPPTPPMEMLATCIKSNGKYYMCEYSEVTDASTLPSEDKAPSSSKDENQSAKKDPDVFCEKIYVQLIYIAAFWTLLFLLPFWLK